MQIVKNPKTESCYKLQPSGTPCKVDDGTLRTADDETLRTVNHNNPHKISKKHIRKTQETPCKVDDGTLRTADDETLRTVNHNNPHKISKKHIRKTQKTPCKVDDGTLRTADDEENWRTREEMEEDILRICGKRWVRKKEIAQVLQRYPRSLQQRFLRPMVESGKLQMLYPDKQNHPRQAYRARKK